MEPLRILLMSFSLSFVFLLGVIFGTWLQRATTRWANRTADRIIEQLGPNDSIVLPIDEKIVREIQRVLRNS